MVSALFIMEKRRRFKSLRKVSTSSIMEERRRFNSLKKCCSSIDRISLLPDELLGRILSHLSFKEATACSLLSRRWKYLWTFTSKLQFDGMNSLLKVLCGDKHHESVLDEERSKFIKWVDNVIALRDENSTSTIEEFKIYFNLNESHGKWIDEWVRHALARMVQRLELRLTTEAEWTWNVPHSKFYTFPCNLALHPNTNFKSLRAISLSHVNVNGETLEFFLSNCPLLEDLSVSVSFDLFTLKVIGPSSQFKRLEIGDCHNLTSVEIRDANLVFLKYIGPRIPFLLENVPLLVDLYVGEEFDDDEDTQGVDSMFSSLFPQLESCTIDMTCAMLTWRKVRDIYSRVKMCKLKQLVVIVYVRGDRSLLRLRNLISASPCLQRLVLVVQRHGYRGNVSKLGKKLQDVEQCYAELKEVEFAGYTGKAGDLELVMHLVNNAAALEKIVVDPCYARDTRFERMSSFLDGDNDPINKLDEDARTLANNQLIDAMPARIKLEILPLGVMSQFRPDV